MRRRAGASLPTIRQCSMASRERRTGEVGGAAQRWLLVDPPLPPGSPTRADNGKIGIRPRRDCYTNFAALDGSGTIAALAQTGSPGRCRGDLCRDISLPRLLLGAINTTTGVSFRRLRTSPGRTYPECAINTSNLQSQTSKNGLLQRNRFCILYVQNYAKSTARPSDGKRPRLRWRSEN